MQIHELNNFSGTLGSGAYLAIDDGNDTGKISSQGLLAATEARIDNIIAGPAPSAEEIVDARLGDDGVTYPSLGDAIRDQFSDVKSALTTAEKNITEINGFMPMPQIFENGQLYLDNGSLVYAYNANRIRTKEGTSISLLSGNTIHVPSGYMIFGAYLRNGTYTAIPSKVADFQVPYDAEYFFTIQRNPASVISQSEIHEIIGQFSIYTRFNELAYIKEDIQSIEEKDQMQDELLYAPYDKAYTGKGWIRYSNGELVSSNATFYWEIDAQNIKAIKAFLACDTNALCAIAFYSTDEISTDGYLLSDSVRFEAGTHYDGLWYESEVPDTCKTIVITTAIPSETIADYKILLPLQKTVADIGESISNIRDGVLNTKFKYIYHLGMSAVTNRNIIPDIPSQSIWDVRNAYNLGYKCIEANVWYTYDGKYVVTHGINAGKLGHDFDDLYGNDAAGTAINTNTLEYLQTNFRYRSSNPDYRVPITTLEEFLHECAKYNLIVYLQYQGVDALNIAIGIMGKNLIMYNAPRNVYDGVIGHYNSHSSKDEIIAYCKSIGHPFIYGMGTPSRFSDNDLQDIVDAIHQNGFYIASAYNSKAEIEKLSSMGFDFFSVTTENVLDTVVINGKKIIFNQDGTVSWTLASVED